MDLNACLERINNPIPKFFSLNHSGNKDRSFESSRFKVSLYFHSFCVSLYTVRQLNRTGFLG